MATKTQAEELIELRRRVDEAKQQRAQAEGRLAGLMQQLESEFGCKTLAAAEALLKQLDAEQAQIEQELAAGIADVKKELAGANAA